MNAHILIEFDLEEIRKLTSFLLIGYYGVSYRSLCISGRGKKNLYSVENLGVVWIDWMCSSHCKVLEKIRQP
jgi:hypothetical protein